MEKFLLPERSDLQIDFMIHPQGYLTDHQSVGNSGTSQRVHWNVHSKIPSPANSISDFLLLFSFCATGVSTTHVLDEHDWCYVSKPRLLLHPLFCKCLVQDMLFQAFWGELVTAWAKFCLLYRLTMIRRWIFSPGELPSPQQHFSPSFYIWLLKPKLG